MLTSMGERAAARRVRATAAYCVRWARTRDWDPGRGRGPGPGRLRLPLRLPLAAAASRRSFRLIQPRLASPSHRLLQGLPHYCFALFFPVLASHRPHTSSCPTATWFYMSFSLRLPLDYFRPLSSQKSDPWSWRDPMFGKQCDKWTSAVRGGRSHEFIDTSIASLEPTSCDRLNNERENLLRLQLGIQADQK